MSRRGEAFVPVTFTDRLAGAAESARAVGELDRREFESLLLAPGFDESEFESFRAALVAAGIRLPDEPEDAAPAGVEPGQLRGEPERDLLDLYLDEIGRFPLMAHEELLAEAARARSGSASG